METLQKIIDEIDEKIIEYGESDKELKQGAILGLALAKSIVQGELAAAVGVE